MKSVRQIASQWGPLRTGLVLLFALLIVSRLSAADRPNIILCMSDDHGWEDVGFHGHPFVRTPHLDNMAAEGIQFDRWYAAAPVCSPTRGSCLTGRHPYRYGIYTANAGHMKNEEITLAEILKEQGYTTGHFGKWHLGTLTKTVKDANRGGTEKGLAHYSPPWENGFDTCFSTESKVPTLDPMRNPDPISREAKKGVSIGGSYGTAYWTNPGERVPDNALKGDDSKLIMDRASLFIDRAVKSDTPFFAVIWFHAPHTPVVADLAHQNLYRDHPHGLYGKHYHGSISALDDQIGRLRSQLSTHGISDDTMLWYSSDNGPESNASKGAGSAGRFRGRKRSLYEGGVRVPGILVWPRQIQSPSINEIPCVTSDYFPTILDALGIELPNRPFDGVSLMPLIRGKSWARNEPICFQSKNVATIQTKRFKLVSTGTKEDKVKNASVELFDLLVDPAESNNIALDYPSEVISLQTQLAAWIASCQQSEEGNDY
jgi:arylsulfatase A-like enzyme